MTECEKSYTDRLHARLRECDRDRRAVRTRLLIVEIIAVFGWLLAVTWSAVAVACGALTVAGWLL